MAHEPEIRGIGDVEDVIGASQDSPESSRTLARQNADGMRVHEEIPRIAKIAGDDERGDIGRGRDAPVLVERPDGGASIPPEPFLKRVGLTFPAPCAFEDIVEGSGYGLDFILGHTLPPATQTASTTIQYKQVRLRNRYSFGIVNRLLQ
jgi:hypothetical protein